MTKGKIINSKFIFVKYSANTSPTFTYPRALATYPLDNAFIPFTPTHCKVHSVGFTNGGADVVTHLIYCPQIANGALTPMMERYGVQDIDIEHVTTAHSGQNVFNVSILGVDDTSIALDAAVQLCLTLEFIERA